ncbi:MAG: PIN domain-containing protein [Methanoregulaceae archaeon]|nr:PIN domain-containing protein [Methanoregulaceae archaeon]
MAYLWDTSLLVHAVRGSVTFNKIDASLGLVEAKVAPTISIVSRGEIMAFAAHKHWGAAKLKVLETLLDRCVVIPIDDDDLVEIYAELAEHSIRNGRNVGQNDLWIAATAVHFGLTVLTLDGDFARCKRVSYIQFDSAGVEIGRR